MLILQVDPFLSEHLQCDVDVVHLLEATNRRHAQLTRQRPVLGEHLHDAPETVKKSPCLITSNLKYITEFTVHPTANTGIMKNLNLHQANATSKISGQILDSKAELIQGGLDMGHGQTQEPKVAWKDSLPAQKVPWKCQQEIFTCLKVKKKKKKKTLLLFCCINELWRNTFLKSMHFALQYQFYNTETVRHKTPAALQLKLWTARCEPWYLLLWFYLLYSSA